MKSRAARLFRKPDASGHDARDYSDDGRWPQIDERALKHRLDSADREAGNAGPEYLRAVLQQEAQKHHERLALAYDEHHVTYADRLHPAGRAVPAIEQAAHGAQKALEGALDEHFEDVVEMHSQAEKADADFEHFQEEHGLSRMPQYPESRSAHFLWVAVIAVFEAALNAGILISSVATGVLGSLLLALPIPLVNIGFALLAGFLFRFVNHRSAVKKTLGFVPAALIGAGLIFFNLFVAHFRQAAEAMPGETGRAGQVAWQTVSTSPLAIGDFLSWVFALIGMLAAAFAAWKGYWATDPYPGYSRQHKKMLEARKDRQDSLLEAQEALRTSFVDGVKRVQVEHEQYENSVESDRRVREQHASLFPGLTQMAKSAEATIDRYRQRYCPDLDPIPAPPLPAEKQLPEVFGFDDPAEVNHALSSARERLTAVHQQCRDALDNRQRRS